MKCFDALWMEECINDAYDAGLDNDKLVLLFLENQHAKIAIKTTQGKSERISIRNIKSPLHSINGQTGPASV